MDILRDLYEIASLRRKDRQEGSYTCYLFDSGLDKILKKCGEECTETVIAAKNGDQGALVGELSDLLYHLTVLMVQCGVSLEDLEREHGKRNAKTGNLKSFKTVDKNT